MIPMALVCTYFTGWLLVAVGLGFIYVPAAVILLGLLLVVHAVLTTWSEA